MEPRTTTLIALAALLLALAGCGSTFTSTPSTPPVEPAASPEPTDTAEPDPVTLTVFYPGSLIIPFDAVRAAFGARYPHVDVHMEGHGSIQVMRHATELDDLMDVAVVADHTLIPGMMYPTTAPETGLPMADWTIEFATNRMVLAYTLESKYAGEIAPDNWYQILARRDVRKAMSDPRFDAAGYRSLMVLQLAEIATDRITILDNVMMGRFTNAITTEESGDRFIIHVPEVLQPRAGSDILTRSYSAQGGVGYPDPEL
jgi:molybdate/tungstate transport system substrate-binding protein